ncbi:MAG: hypothetical protein M0P69_16170 [Bacteroidales bacterium]|jgi:hypothetical protein|nr:hypothetical protein [Bacteroidales bacterium]
MFAYADVYGPDTMGADLKTLAAVDGENQGALAADGAAQIIATDKAKTYNITMALVVMVVLIVLLQMSR